MIKVEFDSAKVDAALAELDRRLSDSSHLMQDIGELLSRSTKERFQEGGPAPSGAPWAPKSPVTLANYARKGEGAKAKPLTLSGYLSGQIAKDSGSDWAEISTNVIYAAVQQFGASQGQFGRNKRNAPIPWGDIPARPFLGVSADDEDDIVATIDQFLTGALR